ncbi:hypothetical protein [Candidatus Tisiphia endosymbiont of Metellina segmentata]|uniref:hypothetical protein n=1 Tax=Candidatus Tisiphia endosymbiont of Metellina segmentata TaxID=3066274 RepID=UPI00313ED89A
MEESNDLGFFQVKKSRIHGFLNAVTGVNMSDKVLIDVVIDEDEGNKIVILGRPPVSGSSKKQMRHVTPYSLVELFIKSKVQDEDVLTGRVLTRLVNPMKIFVSDQLGLCLNRQEYDDLKAALQLAEDEDFYHVRIKNVRGGAYKYLINDKKIIEKIKEDNLFDEEQVEQFKANYTRSMGKFIDYSIDSLQQAIQDQNTIGIAYEAIGRLMLTLFSQMLYTAFPEEGNTLINEIRYYSSAAKAKEPRGHEFEILTHDEAAELAKGGKLQTEKKQDPKVRIVQNEGNRIKKVIDALKAINKIISLVNDRDDDVEIQPKIMEYNEKYNTKIKIRELEKELEDRYNGNVSLQVMMQYVEQQSGDLDYVRYHIAKHLYDAFDFKPLEEKVLVPANESDKKVQSIRLINVLPSAEGSRKAAYHVKDGAEYRKDQINSAIGYNDKVVFREEDLNPSLLAKKIIDHAYLSILPFKSFQEGFKNAGDENYVSDNYPLEILKAFSGLAIKDYGIENDEQQDFMNTLNQETDKIGMFYSGDEAHHSFLTSGEVEAAELYGVNVDFS